MQPKFFPSEVEYTRSIDEAIQDADVTFILTEWDEIKNYPLSKYVKLMEQANIFDGRNCYDLNEVKKFELYYSSIGRLEVTNKKIMV